MRRQTGSEAILYTIVLSSYVVVVVVVVVVDAFVVWLFLHAFPISVIVTCPVSHTQRVSERACVRSRDKR